MIEQTGADDVTDEIKAWLVEHIGFFVEQAGLKPIVVWESLPNEQAFLNRRLKFPALAIACDGLAKTPDADGRNGYDATWRVLVSVWVKTPREQEETVRQVRQYAKAVRTCLLASHRRSWAWVNERYSGIEDQRLDGLIGLATIELNVDVKRAVNLEGLTPGVSVPAPVVQTILVDVETKELS
jgi:hypothetical protein